MTLWEHPEDLGTTPRGCPASVWQLQQVRKAYAEFPCTTAAGYQCQFDGVDYAKPTRILTDIMSLKSFGYVGWPTFDKDGWYTGPLPDSCGHRHGAQMIGKLPSGGFATSPTAAYPEGMCSLFARHIFMDFMQNGPGKKRLPCGRGRASDKAQPLLPASTSSSSLATAPPTTTTEVPAAGTRQVFLDDNSLEGWSEITVSDIPFGNEIVSQADIDKASKKVDEKGADLPIREGPDLDLRPHVSDDEVEVSAAGVGDMEEVTTDEEPELPGLKRPKKGSGWWGRGPPIRPQRKGLVKNFIDGAGYPSPGRWKVDQRRLPDDTVAKELREVFRKGLMVSAPHLPGGDLKKALLELAAGNLKASPFPTEVVEQVRMDLGIVLKKHGFGDGLKQEGDVCQDTEVRLVQALLKAFGDPDHFFAEWWAKGVWVGSPSRRLPRTPALYERTVKWPRNEGVPELHGEWKANYSR